MSNYVENIRKQYFGWCYIIRHLNIYCTYVCLYAYLYLYPYLYLHLYSDIYSSVHVYNVCISIHRDGNNSFFFTEFIWTYSILYGIVTVYPWIWYMYIYMYIYIYMYREYTYTYIYMYIEMDSIHIYIYIVYVHIHIVCIITRFYIFPSGDPVSLRRRLLRRAPQVPLEAWREWRLNGWPSNAMRFHGVFMVMMMMMMMMTMTTNRHEEDMKGK